jgi:DNA replication and repair protein RecF
VHLESIQLHDYRSYPELYLRPDPGLNIIIGPNGQGKSNLLEAIYLLATTRSLRAHRDLELVRWDSEFARVAAAIHRLARPDLQLEIDVVAGRKVGKVNGVRHSRLIDLLGEFNAVLFTPTDVDLIGGAPSARRSFLNLQIAQASGSYAYALIYYKRVLEQRSRLLKDRAGTLNAAARQTLDALTEQLILHGGQILEKRQQFVSALERFADAIHRELAGADARLEIVYRPGWPEISPAPPVSAESFREALEASRAQELRRGMTVVGPHRDDLQFLIHGRDARIYGSRGEQRTTALSLKLAEFQLLREMAGEPPVMLLDDVLSELDEDRSLRVIRAGVGPCQLFMTGASLRVFPDEIANRARIYRAQGGMVTAFDPEGARAARPRPEAVEETRSDESL